MSGSVNSVHQWVDMTNYEEGGQILTAFSDDTFCGFLYEMFRGISEYDEILWNLFQQR